VALLVAGKKCDASHMVDFIGHKTAGPGYGDIPGKSSFGFARRSRRDTLGKFLSVARVSPRSSGDKPLRRVRNFSSQSLMDKDCTCLRNTKFLTG
jgi:hypothetical protein